MSDEDDVNITELIKRFNQLETKHIRMLEVLEESIRNERNSRELLQEVELQQEIKIQEAIDEALGKMSLGNNNPNEIEELKQKHMDELMDIENRFRETEMELKLKIENMIVTHQQTIEELQNQLTANALQNQEIKPSDDKYELQEKELEQLHAHVARLKHQLSNQENPPKQDNKNFTDQIQSLESELHLQRTSTRTLEDELDHLRLRLNQTLEQVEERDVKIQEQQIVIERLENENAKLVELTNEAQQKTVIVESSNSKFADFVHVKSQNQQLIDEVQQLKRKIKNEKTTGRNSSGTQAQASVSAVNLTLPVRRSKR